MYVSVYVDSLSISSGVIVISCKAAVAIFPVKKTFSGTSLFKKQKLAFVFDET